MAVFCSSRCCSSINLETEAALRHSVRSSSVPRSPTSPSNSGTFVCSDVEGKGFVCPYQSMPMLCYNAHFCSLTIETWHHFQVKNWMAANLCQPAKYVQTSRLLLSIVVFQLSLQVRMRRTGSQEQKLTIQILLMVNRQRQPIPVSVPTVLHSRTNTHTLSLLSSLLLSPHSSFVLA